MTSELSKLGVQKDKFITNRLNSQYSKQTILQLHWKPKRTPNKEPCYLFWGNYPAKLTSVPLWTDQMLYSIAFFSYSTSHLPTPKEEGYSNRNLGGNCIVEAAPFFWQLKFKEGSSSFRWVIYPNYKSNLLIYWTELVEQGRTGKS